MRCAFGIAICLTLSAATTRAQAADVTAISLIKIADGVYAHRGATAEATPQNQGDIADIGFVVGQKCVAVIDTGGTLEIGRRLLAALRKISDKPVCYVINTHFHPDHIFGNAAFVSDGTRFVGHAHLPAAIAARSENYFASLSEQVGEDEARGSTSVPPTELIAAGEARMLDLGGRSLHLRAWPTSHTDADLTVTDSTSGTLWTGDLLFVERIPVIDGSLLGWLKTMAALKQMKPRHVVPGHGPIDPPWQMALANQNRYLETIARDVRAALKDNRTLQQTVDQAGLSERDRWPLFEDYNRRNVTTSYTELEWED